MPTKLTNVNTMINYTKQINFLDELGTKKGLFYDIALSDYRVRLQGYLTAETRESMSEYVVFSLDERSNWLKGETVIDGIDVKVILTF